METIAIYWEKQVKVYGIILKNNLILMGIHQSTRGAYLWHTLHSLFEDNQLKFDLISSSSAPNAEHLITLVLNPEQLSIFQAALLKIQNREHPAFSLSYKKVDLIYLHGPHFQERFGILSKAIEPLSSHQIEILLSGCTGNSMYIVVPGGQGKKSNEILHNTFHIPQST